MTPFEPFNRIGQSRYGRLIYNKNDIYIGRSIELYGEYSQRETVVFDQIVQPGHIVLDVGANIGPHTLFFAQKVGPAGRVLAFEPQRIIFQALCGNMAINSVTNVHCYNTAVGAETGEMTVPQIDYCRSGNYGGIELGSHGSTDPRDFQNPGDLDEDGERVPLVTIDSLNLPVCHFIKIDVEGMEEDVLKGAVKTIERLKPILYVECDRSNREASLIRFIDSLGFAMYQHQPELFNPDNFRNHSENVFGEIVSQNLLCFDQAVDTQLTGFTKVNLSDAA